MASELIVTSEGQVVLPDEVLAHLGVRGPVTLVVDLLPEGRIQLHAKRGLSITDLFGSLRRPGQRTISIDEINEATAAGWAGQ
ncbi:AbrB/MazE/SpoVT family DNA-binding domain-containing protein [Nitrospirillum amazonense]|uniref:AbrB/MazE/SpoVT family DNA-binding domain-containing protein n=1 Tax=Nitrospirillum amazonense TaxID=28077 RepID=UPI0011A8F9AD|nr:AbrB/MazE/SpoVT family DNA-binding domain-containing protein [Nitrospirillum amazonense]